MIHLSEAYSIYNVPLRYNNLISFSSLVFARFLITASLHVVKAEGKQGESACLCVYVRRVDLVQPSQQQQAVIEVGRKEPLWLGSIKL